VIIILIKTISKSKFLIILIIIGYTFLLLTNICAEAPTKSWTRLFGSSANDLGTGLSIDTNGNIFVTGYTEGAWDGQSSAGDRDAFVSKYNSGGTHQWTRLLGSSTDNRGRGVATDSNGNVYMSGPTFGDIDGESASGWDTFFTKYDSDGNKEWTKIITSGGRVWTYASTIQGAYIYFTGYSDDDINGATDTGLGSDDVFVCKYDLNGNHQWTRIFGSTSEEKAYGIHVDSNENVYLSGYTKGAWDGQSNSGNKDSFVTKYNSSGTHQWTRLLGTSADDMGNAVSVDTNGNVYITGETAGAIDGQSHIAYNDVFITKYDASGNKQWTKQIGGVLHDRGRGIYIDGSNSIYITGDEYGDIYDQDNTGGNDAFFAKYDVDGDREWIRLFGCSSTDLSYEIAGDGAGKVYIAGYTRGAFDGQSYNGGTYDAFLIKYDCGLIDADGDGISDSQDAFPNDADLTTAVASNIYNHTYHPNLIYKTGLTLWLDGAEPHGRENNPASTALKTWIDFSGNSNHATQTTAGNKPTFTLNAINEKNAIVFDSDDEMTLTTTSALSSASGWTAFFVVKGTTTPTNNSRLIQDSSTSLRFEQVDNTNKIGFSKAGVADYTSNLSSPYNTTSVISYTCNGSSVVIKKGAESETINNTIDGPMQTLFNMFAGSACEIIIYDHEVITTNRANIETYLNSKWLGEGGLPSEHTTYDLGEITITDQIDSDTSDLKIGETSTAILTLDAGADITFKDAYLGDELGSDGQVLMDLDATQWISDNFYIGKQGTGYLRHRGGTVNVTTEFSVGSEDGSNGDYDIEGGQLTAPTIKVGGDSGSDGDMEIKGGTVSANTLELATSTGSTAHLSIDDGLVQVTTLTKGDGSATFDFTGGIMKANLMEIDITNTQGILNPNIGQGTATISGNYTNEDGGTIQIELASISEYDKLDIDGTFDVNGGELEVGLIGAYEPENGQSFTIIECDTIDGSWDDLKISLPRLTTPNIWQVSTSSTTYAITVVNTGLSLDSDSDGIVDSTDMYPNDANAAFDLFSPAGNTIGTLGFEDMWPTKGDMDCNDIVMGYKFNYLSTTDNEKITGIRALFILRAVGGTLNTGFGIQFDELIEDSIGTITSTLRKNNGGANEISSEGATSVALNYHIFNNAHDEIGVTSGFANTKTTEETGQVTKTKLPLYELYIQFETPVAASSITGEAPHNPYIFYTDNETREIHLAGESHTSVADSGLYSYADGLGVLNHQQNDAAQTYKTTDNFPWGISMPSMWDFPEEKGSISTAYPQVISWASGAGGYDSWYTDDSGTNKTDFSSDHTSRVQGQNLSYSLKRKFGLADK
jgi:LruC domain-containing protein